MPTELRIEHGTSVRRRDYLLRSKEAERGMGRLKPDVLVLRGGRATAVLDAKYNAIRWMAFSALVARGIPSRASVWKAAAIRGHGQAADPEADHEQRQSEMQVRGVGADLGVGGRAERACRSERGRRKPDRSSPRRGCRNRRAPPARLSRDLVSGCRPRPAVRSWLRSATTKTMSLGLIHQRPLRATGRGSSSHCHRTCVALVNSVERWN